MGIGSWKKEHYKGRVRDAARGPMRATEHSLVKWKGLRPAVLAKHGLQAFEDHLVNDKGATVFEVGAENCALCMYDDHIKDPLLLYSCDACPLYQATLMKCAHPKSPYMHWYRTGDPEYMIRCLEITKHSLKAAADYE